MKRLHLLIMLGSLFIGMQEVSAQESNIFSHKNVSRVEKASSSLGLLSLITYVVNVNADGIADSNLAKVAGYVTVVSIAANISANIVLGCGYKREKKAFLRAISPGLFLVHEAVHGKISKNICVLIPNAGLIGWTARECADLYYLVRALVRPQKLIE